MQQYLPAVDSKVVSVSYAHGSLLDVYLFHIVELLYKRWVYIDERRAIIITRYQHRARAAFLNDRWKGGSDIREFASIQYQIRIYQGGIDIDITFLNFERLVESRYVDIAMQSVGGMMTILDTPCAVEPRKREIGIKRIEKVPRIAELETTISQINGTLPFNNRLHIHVEVAKVTNTTSFHINIYSGKVDRYTY